MPERLDITRERYGMQHTGPVYRDGVFLIRDRNTDNSAITAAGFITKAAFDAIKPTGNQIQTANIATGMVDMAAGDGLQLLFGGAAATQIFNYTVLGYDPCFLTTDAGKQVITGYSELIVMTGVVTLGTTTLGAAGVAALGGTVLVGDVECSSFTIDNSGGQPNNIENVTVTAANSSPQTVRVGARGSRFLRVLTNRTAGAAAAMVWGKRIQGGGQGSMRA